MVVYKYLTRLHVSHSLTILFNPTKCVALSDDLANRPKIILVR